MERLKSRIERINLALQQLGVDQDNNNNLLKLGHLHNMSDKLILGHEDQSQQQENDDDDDDVSIVDKYNTIIANTELIYQFEENLKLLRGLIDDLTCSNNNNNYSSSPPLVISLIIPIPSISPILIQRLQYIFEIHLKLVKSSVYLIDFIFNRIIIDSNIQWNRIQNTILYSNNNNNKSIY